MSVDQTSGARTVASPMLIGEVTTPTPVVRGDPSRKAIPLERFEASVQSVLQGARSRRPAGDAPVVGKAGKRIR